MGGNYRPNLYQLELDAGKRPVGHLTGEREAAQEVAGVTGQHEQSETDLVAYEPRAGEPRPGKGVLSLLDVVRDKSM